MNGVTPEHAWIYMNMLAAEYKGVINIHGIPTRGGPNKGGLLGQDHKRAVKGKVLMVSDEVSDVPKGGEQTGSGL